jgi:hypothetical protein
MALTKATYSMISGALFNVLDYGADPTGVADSTTALQNAITAGATFIPAGTYRVTSPIILPSNAKVCGAGVNKTIVKSEVVGDSLFKCTVEAIFINIFDMSLEGNNLTGVSGNGHAINFIDPTSGGAFSPQQAVLERLEISKFRGQDIRTTGVATTISSAGVCMYNALQNICRDVYVANCGHGFYMATTQNCRLENCVAIDSDKFALIAYDNENLVVDKCNLLNAGDGVVDPGYPATTFSWGSGVVLSYENDCFALKNSKLKNINAGSALIRSLTSVNDVYDSNWIRADTVTNTTHKAFYIQSSYNTQIINNEFHPSNSGFSATQKYEQIELYNSQTSEVFQASIEGNTFGDVSGMNIAYNIKVGGNANTRSYQVVIRNNKFGYRAARSAACVIDADVVLASCAVRCSDISANTHYAAANVTRSLGYQATTVTLLENKVGPNEFRANSGAITAEYSGLTESVLEGSVTYDPPSLADGAGVTTTVPVTGAVLGDYAEATFSRDIQGITVSAYVSAADTLSVRFQNESGGTLDLASGTLRARVRKA